MPLQPHPVVRSACSGAPVTLNPLYSSSGNEQHVERAMFGALVKMSDALIPTPDLSETIENNPEGTQYTFTLKEGLTFTDGTPLDLRGRDLHPRAGDQPGYRLDLDGPVEQYRRRRRLRRLRRGRRACRRRTHHPDQHGKSGRHLPGQPVQLLRTRHSAAAHPGEVPPDQLKEHEFSLNPTVTGGGFAFVQYQTDQFLEMQRSETYPGTVGLDRIFLPILTPEVGLGQLETGEIDVMTLPVAERDRTAELEGVTVVMPSPSMDFLAVNPTGSTCRMSMSARR